MIDGRFIQQLNPLTVPSKRRNPLLADFFNRLGLMERRGSGMKKIIDSYKRFERLPNYHIPEFQSNASEFHVVLWNLNYGSDSVIDEKEFLKEAIGTGKEFLKAQRLIYKMISTNPGITIAEMAVNIGVSDRQVRKYIKRMTDMKFIVREGGRKNGIWKIIDGDYEDFFRRI
ncbi:ATP-binding protein [Bacteroides caecimuris]|uniref:ATP-binding protein n=1 Tax=Bacteroides caecimuris TaxID=1796613 RepID=UPI001F1DBB7F|nr:ATP-binding protein [Bacteroides caecimuris]UQA32274.1 winged helix-turn-helix transcriptional regulator [Bacteroides caecimuris]